MPGPILHQGAQMKCPHGGTVVVVPATRAKVSLQAIAVGPGYGVIGCAANTPCGPGLWTLPKGRVLADGQAVVLVSTPSKTISNGTSLLILGSQTRVVSI
jgi:hypothetical protein